MSASPEPILHFPQPSQPPATPDDTTGIADVIRLYLVQLRCRAQVGDYSQESYENTRRDLDNFAAQHGGKPVSQGRKSDLLEWIASNPTWKSNHTRKRAIASVLGCFVWAAEEGYVTKNPYTKPRLDLPTEPRRPMQPGEYVALMRGGSRALRRALFFLRRTGARTKEMRDLDWSHIDWREGVAVLERHKTRRKTRQPRLIGLDAAVLRFLANLHRQSGRPLRGIVFRNCEGNPWSTRQVFDRHFRRWADRLGLAADVTPYCARHAYCVAGIEGGLSDRAIADQLGHSTTAMVSWYGKGTRTRYAHLRNVANQVNQRRPRG